MPSEQSNRRAERIAQCFRCARASRCVPETTRLRVYATIALSRMGWRRPSGRDAQGHELVAHLVPVDGCRRGELEVAPIVGDGVLSLATKT